MKIFESVKISPIKATGNKKRVVQVNQMDIRQTSNASFVLYKDKSVGIDIEDEILGIVSANLDSVEALEEVVRQLRSRRVH